MSNYQRISEEDFYRLGGFVNPSLDRKLIGVTWTYWKLNHD